MLHNTLALSIRTDLRLAYLSHGAPRIWQAAIEVIATQVAMNQLQTNRALVPWCNLLRLSHQDMYCDATPPPTLSNKIALVVN